MASVSLTLNWPPSVNHAWLPTKQHGKILSAEYKAFVKSVGEYVLGQHVKRHWTTKQLLIGINCRAPNVRSFDIDNRVKTTLDAIVRAGVIVDDKHVDLLLVHRGVNDPPYGSVDVLISEIIDTESTAAAVCGWLDFINQHDDGDARAPTPRKAKRLLQRAKRYRQRGMFQGYVG